MHIVVSWDISAQGARWTEINQKLIDQLKPYSWYRPLNTFYIVKIASESERLTIRDSLSAIARSSIEKLQIVLTPTMAGGRYDGYLTADEWAQINLRTD